MFKLLHKVTPVWAVTFLFAWTGSLHAADAPPPSPLQVGLAAYEQGDYATAISQLQKPAGEGDRDALFYLGEAVLFDTGRPGYMTRAYNVHKLGAEAGDRRAQFRVAEMLAMGVPVAQDINGALAWLRKSADAGYVPASETLQQVLKMRAVTQEWAGKIDDAALTVTEVPEAVGVDGAQFGVGPQASCTDPREAALLATVGSIQYERVQGELLQYHFNTVSESIVAKPLIGAFYAYVMDASPAKFKSCHIGLGLPPTAVTTARRMAEWGLVEFQVLGTYKATFWLMPNPLDTSGNRLGASVGVAYFQSPNGVPYGCPKDAAMQVALSGTPPESIKSCVPLSLGMVAATGRDLKVSRIDERGLVHTQLVPEVAVFGQFDKLFYLSRAYAVQRY